MTSKLQFLGPNCYFLHTYFYMAWRCAYSVFVHIIFTSIWKNRRFGQRNRKDKDRNPFLNCDEIGFTRAVLGCSYASAYFKFEFKGWLSVYSQFWLKYIQIIHLKIQFWIIIENIFTLSLAIYTGLLSCNWKKIEEQGF